MNEPLRGCPTCGTKVKETDLGLRDFRWLGNLPGRIAPMDIDFLLERGGDFLAMEFKPPGVPPSRGALITFRELRKKGFEVWTVEGDGPRVKVWWNELVYTDNLKLSTLEEKVEQWLELRKPTSKRKPPTWTNRKKK